MDISAGNRIYNNEIQSIEWFWDDSDYLIQATVGEESIMQISYEDLIGLASAVEKVKFDRLLEEKLKDEKRG